jgi:hypothetical protein
VVLISHALWQCGVVRRSLTSRWCLGCLGCLDVILPLRDTRSLTLITLHSNIRGGSCTYCIQVHVHRKVTEVSKNLESRAELSERCYNLNNLLILISDIGHVE